VTTVSAAMVHRRWPAIAAEGRNDQGRRGEHPEVGNRGAEQLRGDGKIKKRKADREQIGRFEV